MAVNISNPQVWNDFVYGCVYVYVCYREVLFLNQKHIFTYSNLWMFLFMTFGFTPYCLSSHAVNEKKSFYLSFGYFDGFCVWSIWNLSRCKERVTIILRFLIGGFNNTAVGNKANAIWLKKFFVFSLCICFKISKVENDTGFHKLVSQFLTTFT